MEGDFERDITERVNLAEILANEVSELRERAVVSVGSGFSDAYQPVERDLGRQKEFFLARLESSHPTLVPAYRELYGEERGSGAARLEYRRTLNLRLAAAAAARGIPTQVPHRLYRGRMPLYDELYVLLCHMVERKRWFNRRRRETQADLEEELPHYFKLKGIKKRRVPKR